MATDGGVYRSTDNGLNWTLRSTGLIATQLYSIGVSQGPSFVLGGGTQDQGIIMSTGSSNWLNSNAGNEGGFFIVDPNDDDVIYTTPWSHNLRRTTNGGATWTDIRTGMTEPLGGGGTSNPADVQHLAVQPGNSSALLALGSLPSGGKIFRSVNQGTNWSVAASINGSGTRVAFAASNHNVAYVTTNNGRVYRTANGGTTWAEPYTAANRPATSRINALGVAWFAPNLLYIGMSGYSGSRILRSFDGGQTWADASGVLAADQLPGMPVNSLVVDQFNPDVVYVAMDIGVFRTRDAGVSWENFSDGFLNQDVPRIIVTELSLRRSNNRLYASTMGRGCYRRNL